MPATWVGRGHPAPNPVLCILRNHSMHGYRLGDFLERGLGMCIGNKRPTAYSILKRMEQSGWIGPHEEQSGNRPVRRVYEITPERD